MDKSTGNDFHDHGRKQMPASQPRNVGQTRAHANIIILAEGVSKDNELLSILEDMENFNSSCADLFQFLEGEPSKPPPVEAVARPPLPPRTTIPPPQLISNERSRLQNSQCFAWWGRQQTEMKKAMSMEKLADIALVDPKRAKRMWANRQSAARSKERKMLYMAELEQRVQALQTETTMLKTQISLVQNDTSGMTVKNNELKLQLQCVEQRIHLQDALNEVFRDEIKRLRMTMNQMSSNVGVTTNHGIPLFCAQHQLTVLQEHQPQLQQIVYLQQEPADLRMEEPMTFENNNGEGSSGKKMTLGRNDRA